MSYTYSRALVEEYSQASYSDIDAFAPLSTSHMQEPFSLPDRTTEHFRLSRFGMTCAPLTDDRGAELLMSFVGDSRARTSAQPEVAQESAESDRDCGEKWPESSVRYDLDLRLWKTAHCLWEEDLPWSSVTLPKWGMTRNGSVCRHPTLGRPISVIGCGLWQTCVADDAADRISGKWNSRGEPKLSAQVLYPQHWPTPTVCGNHNRKGASATSGDGLATVVKQRSKNLRIGEQTQPMRLNPEWVEWLMGWPIGHTGLKPLETGRYQEWLQQHSPCSQEIKEYA